jgi:hypothetical protein
MPGRAIFERRRGRFALLVVGALVVALASSGTPRASAKGRPVQITFTDAATWTVPAVAHSVHVTLYGANGWAGGGFSGLPGLGAKVSATLAVTPVTAAKRSP